MDDHTPGPWTLEIHHAPNPKVPDSPGDVFGPNGEHIVCFGHDYDDYGAFESMADARLIAAAPDLLAALDFLLLQVDTVERTSVVRESAIYREARAAIAKAKGADIVAP